MYDEQIIQAYERFFCDPQKRDQLLKPFTSGLACQNIRTALRVLEYDLTFGDQYDAALVETVRRFQIDNNHTSHDGFFGPGTRRLLTQKLFETNNWNSFQRMADPTKGENLRSIFNEQEIEECERFFRDPQRGNRILEPPMSGIACQNIRTALQVLGYNLVSGSTYDRQLAEVVRDFQIDNNHNSCDGLFGPGTRHLLTQKLFVTDNSAIFQGMIDPVRGMRGKGRGTRQDWKPTGGLPHYLKTNIIAFLQSLPGIDNPDSRQALIYSASLDESLAGQIDYSKIPVNFFPILIKTLSEYGNKLADGRNPLIAVLEVAKGRVGDDKQNYCNSLIQQVENFLSGL